MITSTLSDASFLPMSVVREKLNNKDEIFFGKIHLFIIYGANSLDAISLHLQHRSLLEKPC